MANKYDRSYRMFIAFFADLSSNDPIIMEPPITLEFDITRDDLAAASNASFRLYNLEEKKRNQLQRMAAENLEMNMGLELYAGYGDDISMIFKGFIHEAFSVREGVNFITTFMCHDGGMAWEFSPVELNFKAGTPHREVISKVMDAVVKLTPGLRKGVVGDFPGKTRMNISVNSNGVEWLYNYTGKSIFIDNGVLHCVRNTEMLNDPTAILNAETGLIGTPKREYPKIIVTTVFEPKIRIYQAVQLDSHATREHNKVYKVISLNHKGIISPTVAGSATSTFGLLSGDFIPIG